MKFHIELSADYWDKAPQVKVDINNDVVWDGTVINIETIKYEKEILSEEEVKLNITLYNKQNDQVILKDGKVIKDQTIYTPSPFNCLTFTLKVKRKKMF